MTKNKNKIPQAVVDAGKFLASIEDGTYKVKQTDTIRIAEARLTLAVFGCKKEGLAVTISNLVLILGSDAAMTLKIITPDLYSSYGIVGV